MRAAMQVSRRRWSNDWRCWWTWPGCGCRWRNCSAWHPRLPSPPRRRGPITCTRRARRPVRRWASACAGMTNAKSPTLSSRPPPRSASPRSVHRCRRCASPGRTLRCMAGALWSAPISKRPPHSSSARARPGCRMRSRRRKPKNRRRRRRRATPTPTRSRRRSTAKPKCCSTLPARLCRRACSMPWPAAPPAASRRAAAGRVRSCARSTTVARRACVPGGPDAARGWH